jgi:hypothetical protein
MLRHIVMLTYREDATPEERAAVRTAVEGFAEIPEVRGLVCGDNVGSGPNHHDFVMVADFDDMDAFRRYRDSAAHMAYVAGPAKAVAKLAAIQHAW